MFYKIFILILLLTVYDKDLAAQKDTAMVGVFITNLYDFDLADGSYVAEFWTWTLFKNDNLSFKESHEITKSKKTIFSNHFRQKKSGFNWEQKKCITTLLQDWDVRSFPFRRSVITVSR